MFLSIILPCFNEEEVILQTFQRLAKVLKENHYHYEIIAVNDGSSDRTMELLRQISEKNRELKILDFSRNWGHQCAVTAGLNHCSGDLAVIIDADLQDPPEVIPQLIREYEKEDANVVYAVRAVRKGESIFKKLTASIFYQLINFLSDVKFPVNTGDFRLIDRKVIDSFNSMKERDKYIRGMISWMGFKQVPLYYQRDPRAAGETKYTFKKMMKLAMNGIFAFSRKPLRLAVSLGVFSIFIGLALAIWVMVKSLTGSPDLVPGWASTIITIIFFGGVQMVTIGILGEYIGGIFDEVKKRPEYIIKEHINFEEEHAE